MVLSATKREHPARVALAVSGHSKVKAFRRYSECLQVTKAPSKMDSKKAFEIPGSPLRLPS